ncbi:MAG: hypothetical protein J6I46_05945 [Ruminococcus sp.]|nr:hypothetical protein [Ruminococcus sp.]
MNKVKVEADLAGYSELRNSPEIVEMMQRIADTALAQLGDGYTSEVQHYTGSDELPGKAVVKVYAESASARRENYKDNTIMKAVFGSG